MLEKIPDVSRLVTTTALSPIKPGGWGVIFAHAKFKFKLFLNSLWYESETLWLFLIFTRNYNSGKKNSRKY